MTYDVFKKTFADEFLNFMPEAYQQMEVVVHSVQKVNQVLDAVSLRENRQTRTSIGPILYINDYYEDFKIANDMNDVLKKAANDMVNVYEEMRDVVLAPEFSLAKDYIVFQLINTSMNEELLRTLPHREMEDLSIVYRWVIGMEEESFIGAFVTYGLAGKLDVTEGELFALATENTKRLLPPKVEAMHKNMYVITNEQNHFGAASVLYDEPLQEVANMMGEDLYILPSSVHETVVVPASMGTSKGLADLVRKINEDIVFPEERLSDNVYFYDKTEHTITLANEKEYLHDKLLDAKKELNQSVRGEKLTQRENMFPSK